ncbi:MAG: UDP-N-acetylmuramate dehydrogenase [Clostridia bacterium]|nr:UDP-N-acetylmuramate dehydrogenase [Clostridia bacterium]
MGIVDFLRQIPDIHFTENENMAERTSLKVGGAARYFVLPESVYTLCRSISAAQNSGVKYKIIGNGTNLLVSDKGFDGLIICTKNLNGLLLDGGEIIALCGTPIKRFCDFVRGAGRTGAEGLAGIPATVGGAIYQNAGAFGFAISDCISEVTSIKDGLPVRRKKADCRFGYRDSVFKSNGEFIVSAKFKFSKRKTPINEDYFALRKFSQPAGRTCGSVFLNPEGDFAGRLIERAGLKGFKIGGAAVSDKHANFIITEQGATARDVYSLIEKIKKDVYAKFSVTLKEEVEYLGEF